MESTWDSPWLKVMVLYADVIRLEGSNCEWPLNWTEKSRCYGNDSLIEVVYLYIFLLLLINISLFYSLSYPHFSSIQCKG